MSAKQRRGSACVLSNEEFLHMMGELDVWVQDCLTQNLELWRFGPYGEYPSLEKKAPIIESLVSNVSFLIMLLRYMRSARMRESYLTLPLQGLTATGTRCSIL